MGVPAELDRAERLLLSHHLRDCAACREAMFEEERVRAFLAGLPELPVPSRLMADLMAIPTAAQARPAVAVGRWLLGLGLAIGLWGLAGRLIGRPIPPSAAPAPVAAPSRLAASMATATASTAGPREATNRATPVGVAEAAASDRPPTDRPPRPVAPRPVGVEGGRSRTAAPDSLAGADAPDAGSDSAPNQSQPSEPPPVPSDEPAPTAPPLPRPSEAPPVCIEVAFEAFLDLAGDGGRACPGCDGRFDEADAAAAAATGLTLPGAAVYWIDATGDNGAEGILLTGEGAIARTGSQTLCGTMPITVGLSIGLSELFDLCPITPARPTLTVQDSGSTVRWAVGRSECPVPTATPPDGAPQETPAAPQPTSAPAAAPDPLLSEQPPSATLGTRGHQP